MAYALGERLDLASGYCHGGTLTRLQEATPHLVSQFRHLRIICEHSARLPEYLSGTAHLAACGPAPQHQCELHFLCPAEEIPSGNAQCYAASRFHQYLP
jgi:hypothetical protein